MTRLLRFTYSLCLFMCMMTITINAQQTYSLDLVGKVNFPALRTNCAGTDTTGGSDVWGYTAPDGSDYAIMGVTNGIAFVKVPEMQVIDVIEGPTLGDCYYHRDIQTYGNYAYAVSEMNGAGARGLMIMDLSTLPDSVRLAGWYDPISNVRSHNMHIDTTSGFAYVISQNARGVRFIDLQDPENPVDVNTLITPSSSTLTHDVYADNDTIYVSEGVNSAFSIWDVTDKMNPVFITRITSPTGGYGHNAWPTPDKNYLMTTEETNNRTVKLWDISDFSNVTLADEYLAPNNIAHNAHIWGDLAVISHYAYGVSVVDISDPLNIAEVASYDTYPRNDAAGFWGCWGAYLTPNTDYVYASNFNGDLTVLKLNRGVTGIGDEGNNLIETAVLEQNYPNPFNPSTTIRYELAKAADIKLSIYNSIGQELRVLARQQQAAGIYTEIWDGRDAAGNIVPSGNYFYRLDVSGKNTFSLTRQMMLVK